MSQNTLTQLMARVKPQKQTWKVVKQKQKQIKGHSRKKKSNIKLKKRIAGLPKKPQSSQNNITETNDSKSKIIFMSHFKNQTKSNSVKKIIKCKTCLTHPVVVNDLCDLCGKQKPISKFVLEPIGNSGFNSFKL